MSGNTLRRQQTAWPGNAVGGAVLCGGSSRRMGTDKAFVDIDGVPMAERVAGVLEAAGCRPVVFVGGDADALGRLGRPFVADLFPGAGPVGGVISALHSLPDSEHVVVCACDLADLTVAAVRLVLGEGPFVDDVRVADSGRLEPMLAVWHRRAQAKVDSLFAGGVVAVHDVIAALDSRRVAVDPRSVRNVNRPDDLRNRSAGSTG